MQFAKLFTVAGGQQLLAVLQADEADGEPQVVMTAQVGSIRISFASRLPENAEGTQDARLRDSRMREIFEAFDQEAAEAAWLVAVHLAQRRRLDSEPEPLAPGPRSHPAEDAPVRADPIELGIESYPSDELRGWMEAAVPPGTLH